MKRIVYVKPCREMREIAKGIPEELDFTHGVDWTHTESGLLVVDHLQAHGWRTLDNGLALKGQGCVLPHVDWNNKHSMVWLLSSSKEAHLMLAKSGLGYTDTHVVVGEVVIFNSELLHAWVSRGRWRMIVQEVRRIK